MEHKEVFSKNLQKYMALNGKSRKEVCQALGYSYFTFSDWINGKKMPRMDKVEQLANYFGILKSDLIEDKKEQPTEYDRLSEKQKAFIDKVKQMSDADLDRLDTILSLVENTK
jgi:transcriptional regulator with XRE-family HTH domain